MSATRESAISSLIVGAVLLAIAIVWGSQSLPMWGRLMSGFGAGWSFRNAMADYKDWLLAEIHRLESRP